MQDIKTFNSYHIDNGGPDIHLSSDKDKTYTSLTLSADYYGYPSISTTFHIGMDHIEILEMFRETITKHIAKLKLTQ